MGFLNKLKFNRLYNKHGNKKLYCVLWDTELVSLYVNDDGLVVINRYGQDNLVVSKGDLRIPYPYNTIYYKDMLVFSFDSLISKSTYTSKLEIVSNINELKKVLSGISSEHSSRSICEDLIKNTPQWHHLFSSSEDLLKITINGSNCDNFSVRGDYLYSTIESKFVMVNVKNNSLTYDNILRVYVKRILSESITSISPFMIAVRNTILEFNK